MTVIRRESASPLMTSKLPVHGIPGMVVVTKKHCGGDDGLIFIEYAEISCNCKIIKQNMTKRAPYTISNFGVTSAVQFDLVAVRQVQ